MKTLVIIGVILAILTLYFIVNAEKSIFVNGSEVLPAGTDIVKLILNKAKDLSSQIKTGNIPKFSSDKMGDTPYSEITDTIKTGAEKFINKAGELIKGSIENKVIETFCPAK